MKLFLKIKFILFFLFVLINANSAFAQKGLILKENIVEYNLKNKVEVWVDKTKNSTIKDALSSHSGSFFKASQNLNFGYTDANFWFKLDLSVRKKQEDWHLQIKPAHFDSVLVYLIENQSIIYHTIGGDALPNTQKEFDTSFFVTKLPDLSPDRQYTLLIQVISSGSNKRFELEILNKKGLIQDFQIELIFAGVFTGVCWALFFYNLFLWRSTQVVKDASYQYYILLIICLWLSRIITDGYFYPLLPQSFNRILNVADIFFIGINLFSASLFVNVFLNFKTYFPLGQKITRICAYTGLLPSLLSVVSYFYPSWHLWTAQITALISAIISFTLYFLAIWVFPKIKWAAGYFLVARSFFYLGLTLHILLIGGLFNTNSLLIRESLEIGFMLEIILLSFGMAYRINLIGDEKQKAKDELIKILEEKDKFVWEQNRILEQKVLERTEDIAREQANLAEKNQKLAELNDEKNNLIAIVAHDLKSPLNRVMGLTELVKIEEERLSEEQKSYLQKINLVANQASEMVKQLLDLDIIENQKRDLILEELDLQDFIQELIYNYQSTAQKKEINLLFEIFGQSFKIKSDKQHLLRIFDNLLSNALKFSPRDKSVWIRLQESQENYQIEFIDQGQGIKPEEMPKLFKKFKRLSSQPTGGESSTGLGLAIVKTLIEDLKGEITCQSELGVSTRFSVKLPKIV
jgi:signal transduction histidine kinase